MDNKYSDSEMLKYLAENGIIDVAQMQDQMRMKERESLLASHPFKLWQGSGGYWYTYVADTGCKKGRRLIKKKNKADVEAIIIESVKQGRTVTLQEVFNKFLEQKRQAGIKQATISRYQEVFNRHYVTTGNHGLDVRKLSPGWYCDFIEGEVGRCKLKSKAVSNLKGITKGILRRAKRDHLIDFGYSSVFDDLDVKPYQEHIEDSRQVFSQKELPMLTRYLEDNPDTYNLCLLLMIVTGIRNGELCPLMFDHFKSETCFEIKRAETRYRTENGYRYEVSEAKTSAAYRTVYIPQSYSWIIAELRRINPDSEYLAVNSKGNRLTTNAMRSRLYRVCKWLGFEYAKSPHKCRKTYVTLLLDGKADNNFIINQVGHTSIDVSESHYHYDRKSQEEKQKVVNNIVAFRAG